MEDLPLQQRPAVKQQSDELVIALIRQHSSHLPPAPRYSWN